MKRLIKIVIHYISHFAPSHYTTGMGYFLGYCLIAVMNATSEATYKTFNLGLSYSFRRLVQFRCGGEHCGKQAGMVLWQWMRAHIQSASGRQREREQD